MIPAPPVQRSSAAPPSGPRLRAGAGARITRVPGGQSIAMDSSTWHHPWHTKAYWSPVWKEWVAVVRPGCVNGRAPSVLTTADKMKVTPSFLAPITAWDGAADIAQAARLAEETQTPGGTTPIYVPLYRNPLIPLQFQELGLDIPIPSYFVRRGVTPGSGRRVMSADVILHQPRLALTSQVTFPVDLVLGTSIVTQTLSERAAASNDALKVYSLPQLAPPQDYDPGQGDLLRSYEEQAYDETLISTVFLVSPPNATGKKPDGSWIPFTKHTLFWNLNWSQPILQQPPSASIPGALTASFSVLSGGLGQLVITSLLAPINDMMNQALNVVTAHTMAGNFWTPTGGGSDATFPAVATPAAPSSGFDKAAKLKAARAAAMKAGALVDTLDPAFPYNALPFPLSLLN